jgi:hypothetical protein
MNRNRCIRFSIRSLHYTRKRQTIAPNYLLLTQVLRTRRTLRCAQQRITYNYISAGALENLRAELL